MNEQLSEKESLDLIKQMISSAKNNLQKGMGYHFLVWGYLVAIIGITVSILLLTLPIEKSQYAFGLWILMGLGAPIHASLTRRKKELHLVKTYVDRIMGYVWRAFFISGLTIIFGIWFANMIPGTGLFHLDAGKEILLNTIWIFITPGLLCLYGFALYISGKAYRFCDSWTYAA